MTPPPNIAAGNLIGDEGISIPVANAQTTPSSPYVPPSSDSRPDTLSSQSLPFNCLGMECAPGQGVCDENGMCSEGEGFALISLQDKIDLETKI